MKNCRNKIIFIFALAISVQILAQDIHFSSTSFNPMFFNPSMTAFMNVKLRVSSIYRNQWQTVSAGYNTFFAAFEMQPYTTPDNSKGIGMGLTFTNDVAGSLSFGERDIALSVSYFISLNRNNTSYLTVGIEGMRKNWSMNLQNAEFNKQNIYDDNIAYENLNTYDVSLGTAWHYAKDDNHLFHIGVACFHINQPSLSRFKDSDVFMYRRYFANISYMFPLRNNDKINLNPQILFQHQHNFNELLIGNDFLFNINDAVFKTQILSLGIYLRNTESIVISPKYRFNNFSTGLSYDINISKLSKVSNTYGGFELWLSYSFSPFYNKQHQTKIPCPIF